jgi:hypothetical protein
MRRGPELRRRAAEKEYSMSFFSNLKKEVKNVFKGAMDAASKSRVITFDDIPQTLEALKALPQADMKDEFGVAALCVAALCVYPSDPDACLEMLEYLNGPNDLSTYAKQFLKDRFSDKDYVPRSYFKGATPETGYVPAEPISITVSSNPYSYQEENYCTLYISSGGADSPRQVSLRKKPSTGEWFIREYAGLLAGIRVPVSQDPWA